MTIKKLLVVPVDTLIEPPAADFFDAITRPIKRFRQRISPTSRIYDAEIQYYADMPRVLGRENTFTFGRLLSHLHSKKTPPDTPYPSCHGLPDFTPLDEREIHARFHEFDAVFSSTRGGARMEIALKLARKRGIPFVLFDFKDHYENYGAADIRKELTYDFKPEAHYDLYFKKDLPLGYGTDRILPVAPVPVRPESYQFPDISEKTNTIFYSGRPRPSCQADREEVTSLVQKEFPEATVLEHDSKRQSFLSTQEYWRRMAESKMALSPSGKVWDSLRHCEVGLVPRTILVSPKPYVETVGPKLVDGQNAILYDVELQSDGRYHLKNAGDLVEKLRVYLQDDAKREHVAAIWAEDVRRGHTILARSRYLLEQMEKAF